MSYLDSYARDVVSGAINIREVPLKYQRVETIYGFFIAIMAEIVSDYQKLRAEIKSQSPSHSHDAGEPERP